MKRTLSVLFALGALPMTAHAQVRVGPEFVVNGYTTGLQEASCVAADAAGNFLVVWTSLEQDGSDRGVFGRWHDPEGGPLGAGDFRVNAFTTNRQLFPAVASAPDGSMVVAWTSDGQDGSEYGVYARLYESSAASPGAEFRVNSYTTSRQFLPSVALDASGNFVVVWRSNGQDGSLGSVFGRRFDALGSPRGGEFTINEFTSSIQGSPVVASDAEGNFVVAWESLHQDGSQYGIFARRYDATGARVGGEFRVNTHTTDRQRSPAIASDAEGNFVIVWWSDHSGDADIWGRRYDAAAAPIGDPFRVNAYTTGHQSAPEVAVDPDGAFVVVWMSEGQDGDDWGVFGRRYDAAAMPDSEFRLNSFTTGRQHIATVAVDAQGDFVTAWTSWFQDGSNDSVTAQRFRPNLIFRDGFEDGTLGAWSSASTDGGDLAVSTLAGMKSSTAGLRGVVDDTAGVYVQDDRPRDERRYRARFYFDPNGFDPGEAQSHRRTRIFLAFSEAPVRRVAAIILRRLDGQYAIRGRARLDDNRQADTAFIPITDEPHVIELDLRSSGTPASLTGQLVLSIDGEAAFLLGLDNYFAEVDFVRMGALSVKAGANGTMYWDEFESRRQSAIGP